MLVMEYFPMGSLLAYLRTQKETINDQQLLKFATDIAEVIANNHASSTKSFNHLILTIWFY